MIKNFQHDSVRHPWFVVASLLLSLQTARAQHVLGTYPTDGGPISLTVTQADARIAGLDFISSAGQIVPIPSSLPDASSVRFDASPFTFLLSNSPNQVTYGNLGTEVTLEAGTTTQLSVGVLPDNDVAAAWGKGPNPVPIPLAAVDIGEGGALIGSFPSQGGPLSVTALGRDFGITAFDFQSTAAALTPFDVGPAPFEVLQANTPNQITLSTESGIPLSLLENTTVTLPVGLPSDIGEVQAHFREDGISTPLQLVSSEYGYASPANPQPPVVNPPTTPPVADPPKLDNDDNLLGGGGEGMNPIDVPGVDLPGGGGSNGPSAVPEPTSLMVWMTLGVMVAFQRWSGSIAQLHQGG